jgi:hypothetical protein
LKKFKPKKETFCMLPEKLRTISLSIFLTSRFLPRVRARALRAPVISDSNAKRVAARPPPIAASQLPPKKLKYFMSGIRTGAAHVKGFTETKYCSSSSNSGPRIRGVYLETPLFVLLVSLIIKT